MHILVPSDAVALTHTHPDLGQPQLSPADIQVMRNHKIPVYTVSKRGLYSIDGDGKPFQVFKGTEWMGKDFQNEVKNQKAIDSGNYVVRYQKEGKEVVVDSGGKNYPIDLIGKLKKEGAKNPVAFGPGELKTKK